MVIAFRRSADLTYARERLRLLQLSTDATVGTAYQDFLDSQFTIAEEIAELSQELAVVAAYRVLELNAKRLTRWLDKTYSHFTWPSFARLLRAKTKVDLMSLDHAHAANEPRLLNNAIKHDGKVTKELSKYPDWKTGSRVHPLGESFERLAPVVPLFITDLAHAVLPRKLGGNRPNEEVFPLKKSTA